jgi:nitronate monooxygenase
VSDPTDWQRTPVTELLGIEVPLVLGPFGGVSSVELAAVVSNRGGLGSFGLYGFDGPRIAETIAALHAATDRPFAVNVWVPLGDDHELRPTEHEFEEYVEALEPYFIELGVRLPERPDRYLPTFEEQLDAVFAARPPVVSFVFGVPAPDVLEQARELGIRTIGAATSVEEARALDAAGLDLIVATGMEAGGHRPSFLRAPEDSLVGTLSLVPQVVDAVRTPVIAAGGIADGRGIAAALALGASAVQLGSVFLATEQSGASAVHRAALRGRPTHTVLTRALSGRLARGIPNRLTEEIEHVAPFPVQNWLTGRFRPTAAERGNAELVSLWAGQGSHLIRHTDAGMLFDALVAETSARMPERRRWVAASAVRSGSSRAVEAHPSSRKLSDDIQ